MCRYHHTAYLPPPTNATRTNSMHGRHFDIAVNAYVNIHCTALQHLNTLLQQTTQQRRMIQALLQTSRFTVNAGAAAPPEEPPMELLVRAVWSVAMGCCAEGGCVGGTWIVEQSHTCCAHYPIINP